MPGIEPEIQVGVDGFLAALHLVTGSDRMALQHRRPVEQLPEHAGVRALPFAAVLRQSVERST